MERREFMHRSSCAAVAGLAATAALAPASGRAQNAPGWNQAAFDTRTLNDAVKALGGAPPVESRDVILQAPEMSENGGVVRIGAQSNLAGTTQLALLVEKNPAALAAVYNIPAGTEAAISTNLKMAQSSNVYAIARVGDRFFYAVREVKVTLGGCGG
ncbi:MAG: thiosulfate oxidation carrier protein SoxY [Comamonadaceae bacterium]|nr:MAG: thiosulfate oxidation carrier protein SoxY [Comamonadaceae bacterium]